MRSYTDALLSEYRRNYNILSQLVAQLALLDGDNASILVILQVLLRQTTLRLFRIPIHNLAPRTYLASLVRHLF